MPAKECPLCVTDMRLVTRLVTVQISGLPAPTAREYQEWECPECDYFEEAEGAEGGRQQS